MTIGEQIQNIRIQKGMTQERFAEMLEVSRQSVSKWELGAAIPDVDKIIRIAELFDVSTDTLLLRDAQNIREKKNPLHLGCVYLIVKDFEKSVEFYEKFLDTEVGERCRSGNKFVSFYFDNKCISLMNENNLIGHCTDLDSPYKFVQNYWVEDLAAEHERVRSLNIGKVTEILEAYPTYNYFHLTDPDNNIIEVTGGYHKDERICQSCAMVLSEDCYGTNADGSKNRDYCKYCFENGRFLGAQTLEEKIESNIKFWTDEENGITEEIARKKLEILFPTLKRWKNK